MAQRLEKLPGFVELVPADPGQPYIPPSVTTYAPPPPGAGGGSSGGSSGGDNGNDSDENNHSESGACRRVYIPPNPSVAGSTGRWVSLCS